jgi:hypothetical protein
MKNFMHKAWIKKEARQSLPTMAGRSCVASQKCSLGF